MRGIFCCSDDSPRAGGVDGSTDVFIIFVKKWVLAKIFCFIFLCCFYVMPVSQTGGSDLRIRHICRKMGVGEVDGSTDVFVVYVKNECGGKSFLFYFFVLVFVLMMVAGMGGANAKNRLNIGKMRVTRPMFFLSILKSSVSVRDFLLFLCNVSASDRWFRFVCSSYLSKKWVCGGGEVSALSGGRICGRLIRFWGRRW